MANEPKIRLVIEGEDRSKGAFSSAGASVSEFGKATTGAVRDASDSLDSLGRAATGAAEETEGAMSRAGSALDNFGSKATSAGKALSLGLTAPLTLLGGLAIKAGNELNEGMADVASLSIASDRVVELKGNVKEMQIEFGKDAKDLSGGLYQVISAFGDTTDTVAELDNAIETGAAGRASTSEALSLISATTKGFNDTTLEAQQHVSDLALKTVELGKTTLPELAGSIGMVTSMSNSLGVSQEELFAGASALSGVIGTTSQVFTGQRAVMQSLMAPTENMTNLMHALGFANGEQMVKGLGWAKTLQVITTAQKASGAPLQSFIGSIEGQNYAMALTSSQLEKYTSDLDALTNATGKTDAAYKAQTEGVNASGFALKQAQQMWNVFLEDLNDGIGPALLSLMDLLEPVTTGLLSMSKAFTALDPTTQKWIVGIAAAAAAAGPLLIAIGSISTAIGAALPVLGGMAGALTALTGPIGLVAAGLAALVYFNFDSIKEFSTTVLGGIAAAAPSAGAALGELVAQLTSIGINSYDTTEGIQAFVTALTGSAAAGTAAANWVFDLGTKLSGLQAAAPLVGSALGEMLAQLTGIGINTYDTTEAIEAFATALTGSSTAGTAWVASLQALGATLSAAFSGPLVRLQDSLGTFGVSLSALSPQFAALGTSAQGLLTAIQPVFAAIGAAFSGPLVRLQDSLGTFGVSLSALSPQFAALGTSAQGLLTAIQPVFAAIGQGLTALGQGFAVALGATAIVAINLLASTFSNLVPIVGGVIGQLTASINLIATTITGMTTVVTALLNGDFAGAWSGAQTIIGGFATYAQATLGNLSAIVSGVFSTISTTVSTSLNDFGFTALAAQVDTVVAKIQNFATTIKSVLGGQTSLFGGAGAVFPMPTWLPTLTSWIAATPTWLATLISWTANEPAWLASMIGWTAKAPDWLSSMIDWIAKTPEWLTTLTGWTAATPAWLATLTGWVPATPAWLESLLNWHPTVSISGAAGAVGNAISSAYDALTNRATGDSSWRGGPTWVGEKGEELLKFPNGQWGWGGLGGPEVRNLPAGTQIFTHEDSMRIIADGTAPDLSRVGASIGHNAGGTTRAPATADNALALANAFGQKLAATGDKAAARFQKALEKGADKLSSALEGALQKVPGLFSPSQVTSQDMELSKAGLYQNNVDEVLRRVKSAAENPADQGKFAADIGAAREALNRIGITASDNIKVMSAQFEKAWSDQSLFSNKQNLGLLDQGAIQRSLQLQQQQAQGKANILELYGIQPDQVQIQALQAGQQISAGLLQGTQVDGAALMQKMATSITPASTAGVTGQITSGINANLADPKNTSKIDLNNLVQKATDTDDTALAATGATFLQKITDSWSNAKVDVVSGLASAMNINIGSENATNILHDIGSKIFKIIFQGYDAAASGADYVAPVQSGVNNANKKAGATTTTTTAPAPTAPTTTAPVRGSSANYGRGIALATDAGPNITMNNTFIVQGPIDVQAAAYQIMQEVRRRMQ